MDKMNEAVIIDGDSLDEFPQTQAIIETAQVSAQDQAEKIMSRKLKKTKQTIRSDKSIRTTGLGIHKSVISNLGEHESSVSSSSTELVLLESTNLKMLSFKKKCYKITDLWNKILRKVLHGSGKKLLESCSFEDLISNIRDDEYFTTLCSLMLTEEEATIWQQCVEQVHTRVQSSSSQSTETTTTSCMTVPTPVQPAVAPQLQTCDAGYDALDELFGNGNIASHTGVIQQSISSARNGRLFTLKSPGEPGMTVVKLETYPLHEVAKLDRNHWWKVAIQRSTFTISSIADPKHMMVQRLIHQVVQDVKKIEGVEKSDKLIKSTSQF